MNGHKVMIHGRYMIGWNLIILMFFFYYCNEVGTTLIFIRLKLPLEFLDLQHIQVVTPRKWYS